MSFTFEKFRSEPIAVWCKTELQAKEFISLCAKAGYRFRCATARGNKTYWDVYGKDTLYTVRYDYPEIEFHCLAWGRRHKHVIVPASEAFADLKKAERAKGDAVFSMIDALPLASRLESELLRAQACGVFPCDNDSESAVDTPEWVEAALELPIEDGRYPVLAVIGIGNELFFDARLLEYSTKTGWASCDGVVTHWLYRAPPLPEVIVR